uniref:Uncharacterized protein n=1 Tax=Anguilla anguilla TaxID=7936 RepID=A0A0E9T9J3_ANGAN
MECVLWVWRTCGCW